MSRKMLRRQSRREKAITHGLDIRRVKFGHNDFDGTVTRPNLDVTLTLSQHEQLVANGYYHSTLVGFETEYTQYIVNQNLLRRIQTLREVAKKDLTTALEELEKRSTPELVQAIWGKEDSTLPVLRASHIVNLDQYEVANYMIRQTPGGQAAAEYIVAYEKFLTQYDAMYGKNGGKPWLDTLITAPDGVKKAAVQIRNAAIHLYNTTLQYAKVMQEYDSSWKPYTKGNTYTQSLKALIDEDYINLQPNKFKAILRNLSQYFGYRAEDITETDLHRVQNFQDVSDKIQRGEIQNVRGVHGGNALSDITFTVEVPGITNTPVKIGVSRKLRIYDNFDIHASFNPDTDLSGEDNINDEDKFLYKEFIYLYNNILALTTFARDKQIGTRKTNEARFNNILNGLTSSAATTIKTFREFGIYRALLTAFFGNRTDGSNISLFNRKFLDTVIQNYNQKENVAPPVYLITGLHVYRTADVLNYYLQEKKLKNLLHEGQSKYRFSYTADDLRDLWEQKRDILLNAGDSGNVYTILLSNIGKLTKDRADQMKMTLDIKRSLRL